jgi:hypothetical protein
MSDLATPATINFQDQHTIPWQVVDSNDYKFFGRIWL